MARYVARSASDRTSDWPFWFVADTKRGELNVTADLIRALITPDHAGGVLLLRGHAEHLARMANAHEIKRQRTGRDG